MNFCKHCGTVLENGSKFCGSCGASLVQNKPTTQQTNAALETGTPLQTSERKKGLKQNQFLTFLKKPIVIILAIILIGGASTAAFLLNLSPKEMYLLSEYKTFQKSRAEIEEKYGKSMDFQEKLLETPFQSELVLNGDIEVPSAEGYSDYEMIRELLKAASIGAKTQVDPVNQLGQYGLSLNFGKETAMDVELYQSQEQAGLKVPVLYDKYFYFNFNQFGDLMRMDDPYYSGPETLELSDFQIQDLKFTEKEMEYLKDTYSKLLLDSLSDDSFTLQKGVNYNHNGESMKLRAITLTLSEREVNALLHKFWDQLIEDDYAP